jgi:hypothetical protein
MAEAEPTPDPAAPEGPSHPFFGIVVVVGILAVVGYNGRDDWWGIVPHLLALGFMGWGGWTGLSRSAFEHILKQYPRETREHFRLNTVLCYAVFPGVVWIVIGAPSLYHWLMR